MAKAANSTAKTAETPAATGTDFEFVDDLPEASRRGGAVQPSADVAKISALPEPRENNGKMQYARIWYAVGDAPSEITDDAQRKQWASDQAKKMTNRLSGITRRISKKDAGKKFTVRAVENNGKAGVAVYRIANAS